MLGRNVAMVAKNLLETIFNSNLLEEVVMTRSFHFSRLD